MKRTLDASVADEAGIEALLLQVGPRDEPSTAIAAEVWTTVHTEWQAVVRGRARTSRRRSLSIAASALLAAITTAIGVTVMMPDAALVGSVARVDGKILVASGDDDWGVRPVGAPIRIGETVHTDERTRAALDLGDGLSLRLDRGTTLHLASADRVLLRGGGLYVDASPEASADRALTVDAHAGSVRHVGTQYEVRTHADDIEVSVREGRVLLSNASAKSTGQAGELVRMASNGAITRTPLSPQDAHWRWVMDAAPVFDIENQPLSTFLSWVARETGRVLVYRTPQAQTAAAQVRLRGSIAGLDPDTALVAVLSTTHLRRYDTRQESLGITLSAEDGSAVATPQVPR